MQFTTTQASFQRGLSFVSHAVAKGNPSLPILAFLRVEVFSNRRLKLSATNLQISLSAFVELAGEVAPGAMAVPAKRLMDLVSVAPEGDITFWGNLETSAITVAYGCGSAQFSGMNPEQFPPLPDVSEGQHAFPVPVMALRRAVEGVSVAVTDPAGAPTEVVTGVLAQVESERITFAAADGKRVAYEEIILPTPATDEVGNLLVPGQALRVLSSLFPKEGTVMMSLNANRSQVLFSTTTFTMTAILMNGEFPNFRRFIPKHRPTKITVKTTEFARVVKLTRLFTDDRGAALLTIRGSQGFEQGRLLCASGRTEAGGNENGIPAVVEGVEGEALEIAFSANFLLDALDSIRTPDVRLEIGMAEEAKTPAPAGFLQPVGAPGTNHCFMPLKV